ncbi:MAG: 5-formyltetrahydrofolate cyclo-ligase [Candidatus Raymondbacteria bacterium RifOxyA12_full_50_37]|uniref:5-formyltetrahydrofolate cyclo-ligase n=1 Tax=Candidatus Raymondbacteria bacterium RIFOXYD12_FULL_49_13 TaxID=1817890 RepID=A0A1F7FKP1_UNCRA|nr:MAG: 5-formyltetrahydrofolate cyclo-ligase [Candidatus Raymondbacteria bacterium RifOxyA12_full_50_37]OGJ90187.1 MAG: 5-formyltetrahydrofolate cyclo-ligase [Candidatus Raymondbacteria bacterium RIFOXYA2_FULL_49_16]OGJ97259.1 MAG: 5-formyltetrahydrofolate cyclo-ligase [Candidatus Raymondbacteria bacterium RIFOXYC2_FULL_50_21]OGK07161.1 MAG: 5-formyltetrahydrofolate cyclo-ligase [Candidatus Raymondbacteria bacterium RIFOXYD12_FULL_49_13]OGP43089.1 MAG: 5-formyltetrahydrofolate cyclo-ligase [Ca
MAITEPPHDEKKIRTTERESIRRNCLRLAKELSIEERARQSAEITVKITSHPAYAAARTLFCFMSLPEEVDTQPLIRNALTAGKSVCIPYCIKETGELRAAYISDIDADCAPGAYQIPEPIEKLRIPSAPLLIDLFIVPGVSFDRNRTRMGRGMGYFDRFLSPLEGKKPLWGIAFNEQIYAYYIPKEEHDVPMDLVFSPLETIEAPNYGK